MAKEIMRKVKLQIPAGQASPAPPIGPTLSPLGIDVKAFCDQFNDKTKEGQGVVTPVLLTIYEDRSFEFITRTPPVGELIRRELKIKKGSDRPNLDKVGKLSDEQLTKIAEIKMPDLNTTDIEKAKEIIKGTAKQMGIEYD
ncbi:50S ribosomal protein L11 [Candidatus Dojkabacteria bacterium]|nr:50S ribosomal protein L11 [Candidatus Dojkabacteria bacterium]